MCLVLIIMLFTTIFTPINLSFAAAMMMFGQGGSQMILAGELGTITQIQFGGQHPLLLNSRPHWYFEEGKHGRLQ